MYELLYTNPDQPNYDYPECDYGVDGEPDDPCDIHDFTDPDNEQSEIGSITENTCYVDGWEKNCNYATNLLKSGIADIGPSPSQDSMRIKHPITEEVKWGFFKNYGNEMSGWWADFVPPQEKGTIVFGVDTVGLRYNSPEHIGDVSTREINCSIFTHYYLTHLFVNFWLHPDF
jgi:hypothetical protein